MPYPLIAVEGNPYGPLITFQSDNVLPPAAVYIGPDDTLVLRVRSTSLPAPVTVMLRRLRPSGVIEPELYTLTDTSGTFSGTSLNIPPSEGWIVSAAAGCTATSRGQVFVSLFITRDTKAFPPQASHILLQGYADEDSWLGFPQSPVESSVSGRGMMRSITNAAPGAGNDFTITVPAGVQWRPISLLATLVTSAAVANRIVSLRIGATAGLPYCTIPPPVVQTATNTWNYTWGAGLASQAQPPFNTMPLMLDFRLHPGHVIFSHVSALDAGDAWNQQVMLVEEWVGL